MAFSRFTKSTEEGSSTPLSLRSDSSEAPTVPSFSQHQCLFQYSGKRENESISNLFGNDGRRAGESSAESLRRRKLLSAWTQFESSIATFRRVWQASERSPSNGPSHRLMFEFVDGSIIQAFQDGSWVLLDEINLASNEILDRLASLIDPDKVCCDLLSSV